MVGINCVLSYYGIVNELAYFLQIVDGRNLRGPVQLPDHDEDSAENSSSGIERSQYRWPSVDEVEVRRMVYEAYGRADSIHREVSVPLHDAEYAGVVSDGQENVAQDVDIENLIQVCVQPVYEGCSENRMQCGIVFMTLASVYGVSDNFVTAILSYLAGSVLPRSNSLPCTAYELKIMIKKLGLDHERIDCCPHGHMLFEGEVNGTLQECSTCGQSRFIKHNSSRSHTVFPFNIEVATIVQLPENSRPPRTSLRTRV